MTRIKDLETYVDLKDNKIKSLITVEHRSNNPKRDYLFVNNSQCKHIPCSPSTMVDMCKALANKVNKKIGKDKTVLVIGFAETATAIGNIVADNLDARVYIAHTTREEVNNSKELLRFEEEHSHATTQKLLTYEDTNEIQFLKMFNYILFVEDEISTGKTILNFIKAIGNRVEGIGIGVASICNWQDSINTNTYKKLGIDTYYLLRGKLLNEHIKMDLSDYSLKNIDNTYIINKNTNIIDLGINFYRLERLGYSVFNESGYNKLEECIQELVEGVKSVRIIGTEEFMYIPIKIGKDLEKAGKKVLCHASTRSKIDVIAGSDTGIMSRHLVKSAYDRDRLTYLYNLDTEETDITIVISDTPEIVYLKDMVSSINKRNIIGIRV